MNEQNKSNISKGIKVLLFVIAISLGIGGGIGSLNYASLANKVGDPEGIFWLVGIANFVFWVGVIILAIVNKNKKEEGKE